MKRTADVLVHRLLQLPHWTRSNRHAWLGHQPICSNACMYMRICVWCVVSGLNNPVQRWTVEEEKDLATLCQEEEQADITSQMEWVLPAAWWELKDVGENETGILLPESGVAAVANITVESWVSVDKTVAANTRASWTSGRWKLFAAR